MIDSTDPFDEFDEMRDPEQPSGIDAAEETALESFLAEAVGGPAPPDLTPQILHRLRTEPWMPLPSGSDVPVPPPVEPGFVPAAADGTTLLVAPVGDADPGEAEERAFGRSRWWSAAVMGGLAASLIFFWLRWDDSLNPPDAPAPVGPGAGQLADSGDAMDLPDFPLGEEIDEPARRGIPLAVAPQRPVDSAVDRGGADRPVNARPGPPRQSITLVSERLGSDLQAYWKSVGVTPSPEVNSETLVDRLSQGLGIPVPAEAIADAEQARRWLASEEAARGLATRWLEHLTGGGIERVDASDRERLIEGMSRAMRGEARLDALMSRWLGGSEAPAWLTALGAPGQPILIHRLSSLTMNADTRCIRCHDSKIEGADRQRDYWSFAAFVDREFRRVAGKYERRPESSGEAALFYDAPDGRRRLAEPAIPRHWMPAGDDRELMTVAAWAESLRDSRVFAAGVVNSLWQLIHGHPLRGSAVDPVTAPLDPHLAKLEQELVDDLVAGGFDVGRTVAVILTSPSLRRSVPEAFERETWLADFGPQRQAIDAFAAAKPRLAGLSFANRLDVAMRSIGAKLDTLPAGAEALAQVGGGAPGRAAADATAASAVIPSEYPTSSEIYPVQWLSSLKSPESRVRHLSYLAGQAESPDSVVEMAQLMRSADVPEPLVLQRVWWLVQPR